MGRPAAEVPTPHSPMQWQRDMAFATISVSGTSPATATWSRCSCSWPSLALQLKHYQKLSGSKWTAPTCQKEEKKSAFQLTEDDARLKRVAMRLGEDGQGTPSHLIKGLCARGRRGGAEPSGCAALRARREAGHGHNWLGGEGRIAPGAAPPLGAYALRGLLGAAGLPLPEKFAFAQHLQNAKRTARWKVVELKTITKVQTKDWLQNGLKVLFNLLTLSCRNQSPDDPALMFLQELGTLRFLSALLLADVELPEPIVLFNLLTSSCRNQSPDDPALMSASGALQLADVELPEPIARRPSPHVLFNLLTSSCRNQSPDDPALMFLQVLFNLLTSSCRSQATDDPAQSRKEQGRNSVAEQLVDVVSITDGAFAALTANGACVTWGSFGAGGDCREVAEQLRSGVTSISSTASAFAALKDTGAVVTWGDAEKGGRMEVTWGPPTDEEECSDDGCHEDGESEDHGETYSVEDRLSSGVLAVVGSDNVFAALKDTGEVVAWGCAPDGAHLKEDVKRKLSEGAPIKSISAATTTFAALKEDGRVVPWGVIADFGNGFLLDKVEDQLTDVVSVPNMPTENVWGMFAIKKTGEVVPIGTIANPPDHIIEDEFRSGVVDVVGNGNSFALLKRTLFITMIPAAKSGAPQSLDRCFKTGDDRLKKKHAVDFLGSPDVYNVRWEICCVLQRRGSLGRRGDSEVVAYRPELPPQLTVEAPPCRQVEVQELCRLAGWAMMGEVKLEAQECSLGGEEISLHVTDIAPRGRFRGRSGARRGKGASSAKCALQGPEEVTALEVENARLAFFNASARKDGGAISAGRGGLKLQNSSVQVVSSNATRGGAIAVSSRGVLRCEGSTIVTERSYARMDGGSIFAKNVRLENSSVEISYAWARNGGGILADMLVARSSSLSISNAFAYGHGGATYSHKRLVLIDSRLHGQSLDASQTLASKGGGIYAFHLELRNSSVEIDDAASGFDGSCIHAVRSMTVRGSAVHLSGCRAKSQAALHVGGDLQMVNSSMTCHNSSAQSSGALHAEKVFLNSSSMKMTQIRSQVPPVTLEVSIFKMTGSALSLLGTGGHQGFSAIELSPNADENRSFDMSQ
ncbi:unnamed protein product, partial [Cladocopium goreaui]